jgi:uncharacterized integral membrane protein
MRGNRDALAPAIASCLRPKAPGDGRGNRQGRRLDFGTDRLARSFLPLRKGILMRMVQATIFLAFLAMVGIFAVQNREVVTINFWTWHVSQSIAILTVIVYALGMVSGWTILNLGRRSLPRISERPRD